MQVELAPLIADLKLDLIDVRAHLAVHLDADEVAVQLLGDDLALEALSLHDVAPVAGRIANAEKDGLVLALGALERFAAPRKPVHRIVGVLKQVGARLVG